MITLALVGVGRWGKNIISTLKGLDGANLKYLCATRKDSLEDYPDNYEKFADWRELLKKKDIDGVIIATPPSTHFDLIAAFLSAGKNVFVEKPMVLSSADAENVKKIADASGKVFMVGYQYLFNDYVVYLKKEIEKGSLGMILEVKSEHILSPSRPDIDIFWDAGPHPFSIFQYFFKPKKIISVEGNIEHNSASVKVIFENVPSLEIMAFCLGNTKTRKLTIKGEKGTAVLDETLANNKLAISINGETTFPEILSNPPLENEMRHFVRCIETGERPLTDIDFGCQITEWLETISERLRK